VDADTDGDLEDHEAQQQAERDLQLAAVGIGADAAVIKKGLNRIGYKGAFIGSQGVQSQPYKELADAKIALEAARLMTYKAAVLHDAGIVTTVRKTRGDDIAAACGQLAGEIQDRTRVAERRERAAAVPMAAPVSRRRGAQTVPEPRA